MPAQAELRALNERPSGSLRQAGQLAVDRLGSERGLQPGALAFARSLTVPGGQVLRFVQVHAGLPVLQAEAKVVALAGKLVALTSRLVSPAALDALKLDVRPRLDQAAAIARLKAARPDMQVRGGHLAIADSPRWGTREVWQLDTVSYRPFLLMHQLVDARSGALLGGSPAMSRVQGSAYSTNPVTGQLISPELLGLTSAYYLEGSYALVYRCWLAEEPTASGCVQEAAPDANGNYLFAPQEPSLEDPFAEVQAYYHVDKMYRWLSSSFGFARAGSQQIFVVVNYQEQQFGDWYGYANAFFGDINGDGQGDLVFGEYEVDFAYDADVIYHEFGHLVVSELAGLTSGLDQFGYNIMPASLNEGYADLFSCLLAGDPTVGEHGILDATYRRSLEGQASCPGSLTGEPHDDGLIWSQAIWSVRNQTTQKDAFDRLLYTSLAGLAPQADFQEAAALITQLAQGQDPSLASLLTDEFTRRGYDACSRVVPLRHGQPHKGFAIGTGITLQPSEAPATLQYRIDVPAAASRLDLELTVLFPDAMMIGAYLRQGQPVGYAENNITADLRLPAGTSNHSLQLGDSQAPLVPGASYYLLAFNEGEIESLFTVRYTSDAPPPADLGPDPLISPDGGWLPGQEGGIQAVGGVRGNGCNLSVAADSSGPLWLLLLLLLALRRGGTGSSLKPPGILGR